MSNGKGGPGLGEVIAGIALGIIGGALAGLAIAKLLEGAPVPCPICFQPIKRGDKKCPHCDTSIKWG